MLSILFAPVIIAMGENPQDAFLIIKNRIGLRLGLGEVWAMFCGPPVVKKKRGQGEDESRRHNQPKDLQHIG